MKKGTFEKLKKSFEDAVAIESGERAPARVTICTPFPTFNSQVESAVRSWNIHEAIDLLRDRRLSQKSQPLDKMLAQSSREELIGIIKAIVKRDPSITLPPRL
jgi:hypothetical protein